MKKIKWGIIGLGKIANQFADALMLVEDSELYAVASRNNEKAADFGERFGASKCYGSYEELFLNSDVDIVYIATPHNSHAELSIQAMKADKHVLCEKPIALNYKDAKRMVDTSKETGKFLMEAFWTRFNPSVLEVLELIKNNEIGKVKYINADFVFNAPNHEGTRMSEMELGGGALFDIGVYPVFLSYLLLGIPDSIHASAQFYKTGADKQTSIIFDYKNAQAVLHCSFVSSSEGVAIISGQNGSISLNPMWHETQSFTIIKDNDKKEIAKPTIGKGFAHEIIECNKCIRKNRIESSMWSHQNSLEQMQIIERIKAKINLKYPGD